MDKEDKLILAQALELLVRVVEIDMETEIIICKFCGSNEVVKNGSYNGVQRYLCKKCNRAFVDNQALPKMKHPARMIASVLSMYMRGLSEADIREHLKMNWDYTPTDATIFRWVQRMAKTATEITKDYQPKVGDDWVADETVIFIGGDKYWLFDIIDRDTMFLLATNLTPSRNIADVKALLEKASARAGKTPKVVITDSLKSYIDGVELAYGADTRHILTKGLTAEINTNLIERFQGELRSRIKVMRGFKKVKSAQNTLNGWIVHYNFLRPHESLANKTPAETAGITYSYKTWLDVVNSQQGVIHKPEVILIKQPSFEAKPRRRKKRWLPKHKISLETKPTIKEIR